MPCERPEVQHLLEPSKEGKTKLAVREEQCQKAADMEKVSRSLSRRREELLQGWRRQGRRAEPGIWSSKVICISVEKQNPDSKDL